MAEGNDSNRATSTFLDFEDNDCDDVHRDIRSRLEAAKRSFNNKEYKKALEIGDGLVRAACEPGSFPNVLLVMKIMFLVSKCFLELDDFIQAKSVLNNICQIIHKVCPERIHELDWYIIEIEERQRNIAGAFVLSICFSHHTDTTDKLKKLKAQLLCTCCEVHFIENVFNPLFGTAKKYLDICNPDLAAAVLKELMQIVSEANCNHSLKDDLKNRVRRNLILATNKLASSNKASRNSDQNKSGQIVFTSEASASSNSFGQFTAGDLHAQSEPIFDVHRTENNSGSVKSSKIPTEGVSPQRQENNGKKTTGVVGIQSEGLPLPAKRPGNLVNERTKTSYNGVTAVVHDKKEVTSYENTKSYVKESPAKASRQVVENAASSVTLSNTVSRKTTDQPGNSKRTPCNIQTHLNVKRSDPSTSKSSPIQDSSESLENNSDSSKSTSEESDSQDATDDTKSESIDRSDLESISDMSEINDGDTFQIVTRRKRQNSQSISLPKGIEVICEHFRENPTNRRKVCKRCEPSCFYAYRSAVSGQWKRVSSYPAFLKNSQELHSCFKYKQGKECTGCTHPHGPELEMWKLERQRGRLPEPRRYLQNSEPDTTSQKNKKRRRGKRKMKKTIENINDKAPTSSQTGVSHVGGASQQITQQPSTHIGNPPLQDICYLPKDVTIACQHFLFRYQGIPMKTRERRNVCLICIKRKKDIDVKYAYWSTKYKKWFTIRDRPTNVRTNMEFQHCKDFIKGKRCKRSECTFGHGPEVRMWTMDRDEALVSPWQAYYSNIQDETMNREGMIRPLPLNYKFELCPSVQSRIQCRFGRCCPNAHSKKELNHWQLKLKQILDGQQQQQEHQQSKQQHRQQPHWLEQDQHNHLQKQEHQQHELLSIDADVHPRPQPYKTTEKIDGVTVTCTPENPNVTLVNASDTHEYRWTFCICYKTNKDLKLPKVFLGKTRSGYFQFEKMRIITTDKQDKKTQYQRDLAETKLFCLQPLNSILTDSCDTMVEVVVRFRCCETGSFPQNLLVDFGNEPLLIREFNIDVGPRGDTLSRLAKVRQELAKAKNFDESKIIRDVNNDGKSPLVSCYKLPKNPESFVSEQMMTANRQMTPASYPNIMHQMLYSEEAHMRNLLARLVPPNAKINVSKTINNESSGLDIAPEGYLFGTIELDASITLDDTAGRVCLRKVHSLVVQARGTPTHQYETSIKMLKERQVVLLLFPRLIEDLEIEEGQSIDVDMWFNLDREILCRMHKAVESLSETHKSFLFPNQQAVQYFKGRVVPWLEKLDEQLNENQLQVISTITEVLPPCAPLVVFGPFGTGKTLTLNRAILHLVTKQSNRVLLCTHTNSAADIHIELLDEYITKQKLNDAKPLRIYDTVRNLKTVTPVTQKYCLIENNAFVMPSRADVEKHHVVVTTLTTADHLRTLKVRNGFFTHILIDEAAQAWETEALIPIALAGPNTKIVFTGDHMQMSPEVYSNFDCQYGLRKSLPERLFDHYSQMENSDTFKDRHLMFLKHNYRSNSELLEFPSDNFYAGDIIAMGDEENPAHPTLGSLMFYAKRGLDEKYDDSFLNAAEVKEVVKRVKELADNWPKCWGTRDVKEIAVLAAYKAQVDAIRSELRKDRLGEVKVHTIHNVQGLEFRALFISTVRTRQTVQDLKETATHHYMEFLSDPKLLVTAVTRAKSFVAVIGDPISLCTLGECQNYWRDFISRCDRLGNLHGITMAELPVAQPKQLNPDAPSFVPKSVKEMEPPIDSEAIVDDNGDNDEVQGVQEQDQSSVSSSDDVGEPFDENERKIEDPPEYMDKILEAFVEYQTIREKSKATTSDNQEGFSSKATDFKMIRINGRDITRLITDWDRSPSERAKQAQRTQYRDVFDQQDNLSPEVLKRMVQEEPDKYMICQIRIGQSRSRTTYLEFSDRGKPDVKISSHVKQAFDRDTVVVDMTKIKPTGSSKADCIVGVLHHLINPREREYVCRLDDVDDRANAPMIPINKSIPKIANMSDESCTKIPIFKRVTDSLQRLYKIRDVDPIKAREKMLLFVVQFLQWRSDCYNPLGIAIRTLSKGESLSDSLKIIQIEHGVKVSRDDKTESKAKEDFPPNWVIPKSERSDRNMVRNAFTIDPENSQDLDDAVSIDELDSKTYMLGIHIADVSYFVQPGSKVDEDARQRGTTYYSNNPEFENINMLPLCLSENHCSLKPKEDRLTQSVYVTVNIEGEVIKYPERIESTITNSFYRLTYSQAQTIIEKKSVESIPEEKMVLLRRSIPLLHSLAQKLRHHRFGAIKHCDEIHDTAAHELIEEMMVLANRSVGKILAERSAGQRNATPFVSHLGPKEHKLNEWAERYGKFAKYNPFMKTRFESSHIFDDMQLQDEDHLPTIDIYGPSWEDVVKLVQDRKYEMIHYLICNPRCSPQLQLANGALTRFQTRSEYKCPQGQEQIHHYDMGIDHYVHFTSPIRRYMDIVIQRQVKSSIVEQDLDKMETFCRRSTFIKDNSRKYSREFKRICYAHDLKENNEGIEVLIDELDSHSFVVHTKDPDLDLFSHHNNRIAYQDLAVFDDPDTPDENLETTLTWRIRLYTSPTIQESGTHIASPWHRERKHMKIDLFSLNGLQELDVRTIPGEDWLQLIEASIQENNAARQKIKHLIERIQKDSKSKLTTKQKHRKSGFTMNGVDVQPFDEDGHYYTITMKLRQFNTVYVQLFPSFSTTLPSPDIQLLKITSNFDICIEHQRLPRQCFAKDHYVPASLPRPYDSIKAYIDHWRPVLALEIVAGAVSSNEGFVLRSHRIKWSRQEGNIVGKFSLKDGFCFARQLFFHQGDLACVRIPWYGKDSGLKRSVWVGHCVLSKVDQTREQKQVKVTLAVRNMASKMPDSFFCEDGPECDMQIIHVPVPLRRMNFALTVSLKNSSDFVKSVCCGRRTKEEAFDLPKGSLSLADQYARSGFYPLNKIQRKAVRKALRNTFSLIQGPPGTGKTVTGVHIAYWFTKQNSLKQQDDEDGLSVTNESKENEEDAKTGKAKKETNAPPQVLYCGPSNKSVDVVTEYLLRIPGMKDKILRVYGSMIEETEYPIPNKVTNVKPPVSDDELKIPEGQLKEVSLHHVIRSSEPFGSKLKKMEAHFRENKEKHIRTSNEDVRAYCELIYEAEAWAVENTGKEIILCTCSRSGSKLINEKCNIVQCIVDESGMCMEPEILVPLTSSDPEQIVLIGDHKQLQPIVTDKQAGKLGLVKSMFERLHMDAEMLQIQYRMNSSICDFPSYFFYGNKLETDESVKNRETKNLDFWPCPRRGPVAFCHVEGAEEVSVIATADSGAESKYNEQEANKVVEVAKLLVNTRGVDMNDIVILTPYRAQRKIISEKLKGSFQDIKVTTIIKSQGSEWDYVIVSLVRSVPKEDIDPEPSLAWLSEHLGFITDEHQINVALTRAKHGLCIVGNKNVLSLNETWYAVLQHYESRDYIVNDYDWPVDRRYRQHHWPE